MKYALIAAALLLAACAHTTTQTINQPTDTPVTVETASPTVAPTLVPTPVKTATAAPSVAPTASKTATPTSNPLPATAFFGTVTQANFYPTTGGFVILTTSNQRIAVYGPKPYTLKIKAGDKVVVDGKLNKNGAVIATKITIQ